MKRAILLLSVVVALAACVKPDPFTTGPARAGSHSVAALKSLYTGRPLRLTEEQSIRGYVVSRDDYGSLPRCLALADSTGAILVRIDSADLYRTFPRGVAVRVYCTGLWLGDRGGMIELGGEPSLGRRPAMLTPAEVLGHMEVDYADRIEVAAHRLTVATLSERWVGCPVRFEGMQFIREELGLPWCDLAPDPVTGRPVRVATTRHLVDGAHDTLPVRTVPEALFATQLLPHGRGAAQGILMRYAGHYEIVVDDYQNLWLDGERAD